MKFEKWFENFNRINSGEEDKETARIAWDASKKECLKILSTYTPDETVEEIVSLILNKV